MNPQELKIEKLTQQKNNAYAERNKILAAFAWTVYRKLNQNIVQIGLTKHPEDDKQWESDWRNILVIMYAGVQLAWHFHDSEMYLFKGLPRMAGWRWDGHTTEEKYERLLELFL